MFTFKETIKASKEYKIYKTDFLLDKTKEDSKNAMFHDLLLLSSTDYTDLTLLNGDEFVMTAQSRTYKDFKHECLDGNNEAAELEEMFITRKGNKYIYWRDIETKEDFLTKFEEDLILC